MDVNPPKQPCGSNLHICIVYIAGQICIGKHKIFLIYIQKVNRLQTRNSVEQTSYDSHGKCYLCPKNVCIGSDTYYRWKEQNEKYSNNMNAFLRVPIWWIEKQKPIRKATSCLLKKKTPNKADSLKCQDCRRLNKCSTLWAQLNRRQGNNTAISTTAIIYGEWWSFAGTTIIRHPSSNPSLTLSGPSDRRGDWWHLEFGDASKWMIDVLRTWFALINCVK